MAVIPTSGVTMATVRDTLASYGGTVSNNLSSFFTTSAKINMWSKHKPVILAKDFCQDISAGMSDYNATWWQGSNGMCGLTPKRLASYRNVPDYMDGENNGWVYALPSGGSSSPQRLGDFAGYNPDAYPLIDGFAANTSTIITGTPGKTVSFYCRAHFGSDYYQLSFADFPEFKNYYFGVYLTAGSQSRRATCSSTLGEGGSEVTFNTYGLPSGSVTAYPFISSEKQTQDGGDVVANYWTVPTTKAVTLKAVTSGVSAHIMAENITTNRIHLVATVSSTGMSYSASTNYITIRFASKDYHDPLVVGEKSFSIGSFSLSADETKTIYEGNVTVDNDIWIAGGMAWLSINAAEYITSFPFGQPFDPDSQT